MKRKILILLLCLGVLLALCVTASAAGVTKVGLLAAFQDSSVTEIQLTADLNVTGQKLSFSGRKLMLDLNGHVLNGSGFNSNVTSVSYDHTNGNPTTLIIKDSNPTASHTDSSLPKGGVICGGTGSFLNGTRYGGGVYVGYQSKLIMESGSIANCTADQGGGVYVGFAFFEMRGSSQIYNCTACEGGGVCVDGGTLLVKGGKITIPGKAGYGGGVAVKSGTFTMTGGEITGCKAGVQHPEGSGVYNGGFGGGVYGSADSAIQLSGNAAIRNCQATVRGGIYCEGNLTITGDAVVEGEIIDDDYEDTSKIQDHNTAAAYVKPAAGCTAEISGGTFKGTVKNDGGTISGGTFQSAVTNAGGTISGGVFEKAAVSTSGEITGGVFYKGFVLGTTVMGYTVVSSAPETNHTHTYSDSWSKNETHHWYAYTGEGCNEKKGYSEHGYSDDTDTDCNTCGYTRTVTPTPEPGHTHSYSESWSRNTTHHWHVCTGCSEKSDFDTHDYGGWTVLEEATSTKIGERERICATCGYTERQTIPATGGGTVIPVPPVTPVTPVTPATPTPPKTEDNGGKHEPDTDDSGFTDVEEKDWFADDVRYVSEKGLMNGTGRAEFAPNEAVTRGMVVTILARMEGVNTSGAPWYAAGRKWAMENGISDGTNMEAPVTREQLAAMLFRYAVFKGMSAVTLADHLSQFRDRGQISGWAVPAANWAVGGGILNGRSGGILDPQGTATRAELAAMLRRFADKMN